MDTLSINEALTIELVRELGAHTDRALILSSFRTAQDNVVRALSLNADGSADFLARQRPQESVETILRRTRLLTQGRLF